MLISVGQPLLTSHYVCDLHLPVVNHVCEVESRPPVFAHYNEVVQGFELQFSEDLIKEGGGHGEEIGFDSHCVRLVILDFGLYLVQS